VLDLQEAIVKETISRTLYSGSMERDISSAPGQMAVVEGLVEGRKLETSVGTKSGETLSSSAFLLGTKKQAGPQLISEATLFWSDTQVWSNLGPGEFSLRP